MPAMHAQCLNQYNEYSFCLLPDGSPHLLCGAKFFQKIEWLMWPPALKRSIDAAATAPTPSPASLMHVHTIHYKLCEYWVI